MRMETKSETLNRFFLISTIIIRHHHSASIHYFIFILQWKTTNTNENACVCVSCFIDGNVTMLVDNDLPRCE